MSQQDSNDDITVPEEVIAAFVDEPKTGKDVQSSEESEEKQNTEPKKDKRMSKGLKIGLLVFAWILLMGGAVGLAFLLRPKIEIVAHEEEFKWNEAEKEDIKTVDVDFYSLYDANAIEFEYPFRSIYDASTGKNVNPNFDSKLQFVPQINGLKNKDVQAKINQRIVDVARNTDVPESQTVQVKNGDNMFNVLSIMISGYYEQVEGYSRDLIYNRVGLNFDLTTGDEITFDDIFVKGANVESIVFKRFYNTLSTKYSFDLLNAERGISGKESGACTMWCDPNLDVEEYYAQKEKAENNLANIEEIAMNETRKYLAGEKRFYLESAGPVFIYNDGPNMATTNYFAPDDVQYFAYLGEYRTSESIYEDDAVGLKNVFLSSVNTGYSSFGWVEETDEYFIDYLADRGMGDLVNKEKTLLVLHDLVNKALNESDKSKYLYIRPNADVTKPLNKNYWTIVNQGISVYEMDKEYFRKVFRKAIFDGKTHMSSNVAEPSNPGLKAGSYDGDMVVVKLPADYGITGNGYLDDNDEL